MNDNKYFTTIGLEIHAELNTNSKMFCGCKNDPDEIRPNVNICPVCMAHPGTLPVPNKKALESVIKVGLALDAKIANFTEFDRKNYFYPDIPKAYQITQYKYPLVSDGILNGIKIKRIHLEEDTANSKHEKDYSLIDFNRAGVPLMELVTEACIFDEQDAYDFAKEFQLVLQYLGVSNANMEKGEMRVELNISISPNKDVLGTKVEVKNINSFNSMLRAAKYEIARMSKLYDEGREGEIVQETKGWDDAKQATYSQRSKENSEDYRYFPDPDIPKIFIDEIFDVKKIKSELKEIPSQKRKRFKELYGANDEAIEILINDMTLATWYEEIAFSLADKSEMKTITNFVVSDVVGLMKKNPEKSFPDPKQFGDLVKMFEEGKISSRVTKDVIEKMITEGIIAKDYIEQNDLFQKNDTEGLKVVAQKVIDENPQIVAEYKAGKLPVIMSLVGKIMKETNGSANPQMAQEVLKSLM